MPRPITQAERARLEDAIKQMIDDGCDADTIYDTVDDILYENRKDKNG